MRLAIGITLLVLAGLGLLGALGALAFAMLGFVGILADVSTAENQAFARDFLRYAGYTGLPGLVLLGIGLWVLRSAEEPD